MEHEAQAKELFRLLWAGLAELEQTDLPKLEQTLQDVRLRTLALYQIVTRLETILTDDPVPAI